MILVPDKSTATLGRLYIAVLTALLVLNGVSHGEELTLVAETQSAFSDVTVIDLSSDGRYLAVGSERGEVEVHSLVSAPTVIGTLTGMGFSNVLSVEFSVQADRLILGGSGDVFAAVVNTTTWETEHLAAGNRVIDDVHDIGGVVFYLRDASMRQVVMLDMTSNRPHVEYIAGSVSLLGHSLDRRRIVIIDQRQVMLLDAATMRVLSRTPTVLSYDLTSVALVGQGYTALLGTKTGDVLILDVLDGRVVDTLHQAHDDAINHIEVTENGIYTAGADGALKRWSGYEQHASSELITREDGPLVGLGVTFAVNMLRSQHPAAAFGSSVHQRRHRYLLARPKGMFRRSKASLSCFC